jgi:hypothetical protein
MRFIFPAFIFFGIGILSGCNSGSNKTDHSPASELREGETFTQEFGRCDSMNNSGVSVNVKVWQPNNSGDVEKEIALAISKKVLNRINSYADSASLAVHPDAKETLKGAYEVFSNNYRQFKKDFPEAPGCWEIEVTGDTVMTTPRLLFYQFDHYSFTGGAHPNSFRSFHVFDLTTGKETDVHTFVSDSVTLLKKVEQAFRREEKLEATTDLEEAGYFLADHRFFIPANYIFTREGLLFYYNPYEIAAYARGPISFTIPYSELIGIIKKEMIF